MCRCRAALLLLTTNGDRSHRMRTTRFGATQQQRSSSTVNNDAECQLRRSNVCYTNARQSSGVAAVWLNYTRPTNDLCACVCGEQSLKPSADFQWLLLLLLLRLLLLMRQLHGASRSAAPRPQSRLLHLLSFFLTRPRSPLSIFA